MVKVIAQGKTIECSSGANLRQEGEVSEPNWKDKTRRSLPPHSPTRNLRLACQTKVLGDVKLTKFDGFWGQGNEVAWKSEVAFARKSEL